jgi:hypothetical protein
MIRLRIQPQTMLNWLIAAHIVAGCVVGSILSTHSLHLGLVLFLCFGLLIGLFFVQVALVGFWATFGHSPLGSRMIWFALAILYWFGLFYVVADGGAAKGFFFLMLGYMVIVNLSLLALRMWVARLDRRLQHARAVTQFQIRHLFLLTLAISLLLALGKWIPPGGLRDADEIVVFVIYLFISGSIALGAIWAMLSKTSFWLPALLVLGYAAVAGWFLDSRANNISDFYFMTFLFTAIATMLLVSLGIVRLCGYRLVPVQLAAEMESEESAAAEEETATSETFHSAEPFSG